MRQLERGLRCAPPTAGQARLPCERQYRRGLAVLGGAGLGVRRSSTRFSARDRRPGGFQPRACELRLNMALSGFPNRLVRSELRLRPGMTIVCARFFPAGVVDWGAGPARGIAIVGGTPVAAWCARSIRRRRTSSVPESSRRTKAPTAVGGAMKSLLNPTLRRAWAISSALA